MIDKEIIILGDVEMGAGNLTDDFISDKTLSNLIIELSKKPHSVDLVFNGDTFDFLKCPYFINGKITYPRHITKEISLAKLKLIHQAHQPVFTALKKFLKSSIDNNVYFVLGNHDHDLVYKSVQNEIKQILNNKEQVRFPGLTYRYGQVYAEHGHQYDFLNKISLKHSFLTYENKKILNIPWVSFGLISKFMQMKEIHPFMERTFPRPALFSNHDKLFKKMTFNSASYFLKSMLYYPFKYRHDPTYTYPKELLREFYRRLKNVHWDVDQIVHKFKRKKKRLIRKNRIHVLGHIHEKYLEDKEGTVIIHPGSWRDEYDFHPQTRKLIPRPKRYVQVIVSNDSLKYQLVELPLERNDFDFDQVMSNELEHIKQSAQEEKYKPIFY